MGASLTLTRQEEPDPQTMRSFGDGMSACNARFFPGADGSPHWPIGRDGAGALSAGRRFVFKIDWTLVSWLWVAEPFRRQDEGSARLAAVEAEARARGQQGPYVDMFSFQAPLFHPKHGFGEFGRIMNFRAGFDRILLRKRF